MRTVWLAVGFAAGYVLGAKAGRERYDQITQTAQDLMNKPAVADAQSKAKELAERGRDAVMSKVSGDSSDPTSTGSDSLGSISTSGSSGSSSTVGSSSPVGSTSTGSSTGSSAGRHSTTGAGSTGAGATGGTGGTGTNAGTTSKSAASKANG